MPRFTFMPMASEAEHAAVGKQITYGIKHKHARFATYPLCFMLYAFSNAIAKA
jgi:hypothetical protein